MKKETLRKWANRLFPGVDLRKMVCTKCYGDPPIWYRGKCGYCDAPFHEYAKKLYHAINDTSEKELYDILYKKREQK